MRVLILAAGYATRLYPLTRDKPKCLLSVGGKTILDALCEKVSGVRAADEIVVVTNAKFFDQLNRWSGARPAGPPTRVISDGTVSNQTRLGAIGDLALAVRESQPPSDILMLAGDNLFDEELTGFVDFALSKKDAVTVGVYDIGDPARAAGKYGVIRLDDSRRVLGLDEKPEAPQSSLIGTGVYYFPERTLKFIPEYLAGDSARDAPGYFIRWLLDRVKVFGFIFCGTWYDIGDLKALQEANRLFTHR